MLSTLQIRRLALAVSLLSVSPAVIHTDGQSWQVDQGQVRVTCPMTIGGSFNAKTTSLTGTVAPAPGRPSLLTGDFSVDLSTLDTGIGLRNEHLRNNYLEVGKGEGFSRAVLSNIDLGSVDSEGVQGRTNFTGTLLLHGTKKTVSGSAEIRRTASTLRVTARFPLTISDYAIAKPQYLGVGVRNQIQVEVTFAASPAASIGAR
jgi:polyisoprenoid-binding protein YceI